MNIFQRLVLKDHLDDRCLGSNKIGNQTRRNNLYAAL